MPSKPKSTSVETEIRSLISEIQKHDHQYYVLDEPSITDAEYDKLYRKLEKLELENPTFRFQGSPTQRVGGKPLELFGKVKHVVPMLSLANALTEDEFSAFDERAHKFLDLPADRTLEYFAELKFDGLSLSVTYEDGILTKAATRGDGETGEDVTQNVKTIRSIPLRLNCAKPPKKIELRGEVILQISDFEKLNKAQEKAGQKTFANPRNAAAGTLRQLDSAVVAARPLKAFFYALGGAEGFDRPDTLAEFEDLISEWGVPVGPQKKICKGPADVLKFYRAIQEKREKLPFEIDGIVVKLNSFEQVNQAGWIARSPRGMIAFKYPPKQATTLIEDIQVQVGRTGALTPVALVTPVNVGGVIVRRATLHNQDEIDRKDIRIGDHVTIQRAGDVIPEVVEVLKDRRRGDERKFLIPDQCPICKSPVERKPGEAIARCVGKNCAAKFKERLRHFVMKDALNVEGLGEKVCEQLVDAAIVEKLPQLFDVTKDDLLQLEGFADKSAAKLITAIDNAREPELYRLIFGLGIRHVGEATAKLLAQKYRSLTKLSKTSIEELQTIDGVGEEMALSLVDYFKDKDHREEILDLMEKITPVEPAAPKAGGKFEGKTFVLTGTLPTLSRSDATKLIENEGGKVASSVSKKTDFVLAGAEAGSKLDKATELGVRVLDEREFQKLIG